MTIHLEDHTSEVTAAFKQAVAKALEMCGMTAEGYAKLDCPVDTDEISETVFLTRSFLKE